MLFVTIATMAAATATITPRTSELFDTTWHFHLGPVASSACNASSFPIALDNVQCLGLTQLPGPTTPAECVASACSGGWGLWQFADGTDCWAGASGACTNNLTNSGWVGGTKAQAPTPTSCDPTLPCNPGFDDSAWRVLDVPHDFVIEGTINPNLDPGRGSLPTNVSWYRKSFALPSSMAGQLVWLTFDGVFRAADIYINGAFVMHHEEGYTSFHAYLHNATAPLNFGPGSVNVLAVFVDATNPELWCLEGGGIYRHVHLHSAPPLSFVPWSLFSPTFITGAITGSDATAPQTANEVLFMPQIDLQNAGAASFSGFVTFVVTGPIPSATVVASASAAVSVDGLTGWARVVPTPVLFGSDASPVQLWNTAISPPRYAVSATLHDAANVVYDAVNVSIGVRSALFDTRAGFLLNGVKVYLQGTSNHLGFGGLGVAVPDRVMEFQIATLKNMGGNAFRTAHNPVAPELLDAADQYGMLVWEETTVQLCALDRFITAGVQPLRKFDMSGNASAVGQRGGAADLPVADPVLLQDAQDMVLRDRNHPSIVIWSLCNELGCVADSPTGHVLAAQFKRNIYAADPSRPITGNTVQSPYLQNELVDAFSQMMDVQSFSYEYNAYSQYRAQAPFKPLGGGESGSCVTDRGYYGPENATSGYLGPSARGYFACIASSWTSVVSLSYVYGNFLWTGFDYGGETYPLGYPDTSSHFGLHDLAGFAKDGVGYYLAWWRDGPNCPQDGSASIALSVSPNDWTQPVPTGTPIDVVVLTCAATVALYLNGAAVGAPQEVPRFGYATFPGVKFYPGNLTAVAMGPDGTLLAVRSILTAGPAHHLRVWVENVYAHGRNGSVIAADGADVALIGVALEDANGVLVPQTDVNVTFTVSGPGKIVGVANGDPADHGPAKASWRMTFHGLARAIVASSTAGDYGPIVVTASAAGPGPAIDAGSATIVAQ